MSLILRIVCLVVGLLGVTSPALATPEAKAVRVTSSHITEERYGEAIRAAEAAADRQVVHPDLSFNRGLAYLRRATSSQRQAGDLGQAAAGFAEALQLRDDDAEAERGLEHVQLLVAQDRSNKETSPESSSLGLVERILLGIPMLVLLPLGVLGCLLLVVGLLMRRARGETRRAAGSISALLGALLLVPSFALSMAKDALFGDLRVAVVIADRAEVVDEGGGRVAGTLPYRQGTVLYLGRTERGLASLKSLGLTGKVPVSRLRILANKQ